MKIPEWLGGLLCWLGRHDWWALPKSRFSQCRRCGRYGNKQEKPND